MGGDFNAHTGTLSNVALVNDVLGDLPLETDVGTVLSAAGCLVSRSNKNGTPDRNSHCKKLIEMFKK